MGRFNDFERTFAMMDDLRRRMDRMFEDVDHAPARGSLRGEFDRAPRFVAPGPRVHLFDAGSALVVRADLPGMRQEDLQLTLNQDVLTLAGERKADAPEGYQVHRQERSTVRFSRSFQLPSKVDAEKTTAILKNGVLTLTLPKVPEAQPRRIAVQAQ
ncbi:MAG: Hsp20/alpha crystallin family protein [Polyangiaceae bacterium]|nr:Hsp20/alpha crystallin family protein [Polyangiaceae bacterium]